jgi:hypothetical protein
MTGVFDKHLSLVAVGHVVAMGSWFVSHWLSLNVTRVWGITSVCFHVKSTLVASFTWYVCAWQTCKWHTDSQYLSVGQVAKCVSCLASVSECECLPNKQVMETVYLYTVLLLYASICEFFKCTNLGDVAWELRWDCIMAHVVGHQPVTADSQVHSQSPYGIYCCRQWHWDRCFLRHLGSPLLVLSINALYSNYSSVTDTI